MTGRSIFARAAELEAAGRSFAVATVVAVQRPTSARPGASGIVHPDGTIEGWVGGSCAQPVVVREAMRSLVDGQPRLLRLSKDAPAEGRRGDGVLELVMTCHSGGTLEIYVEPHLPAPVLWVAGTTPIAGALVALGSAAGWRVTVIDPIAERRRVPGRRAGPRHGRPQAPRPRARALRRSSRPRGSGTRRPRRPRSPATPRTWASCRRRRGPTSSGPGSATRPGVPEERLAALRAPAGMDIGAEGAEEVALSILAELVQVRRGRARFRRRAGAGHGRRRRRASRSSSSPSSTTSSCSTRSAA